MVRVFSFSLMPRSEASASSSRFSDGMLGSKVVSSARSEPASIASSIIASLGFSTGTRTSFLAASMAVPKAEQVNSTASAPQRSP
ncbi:hypothetical protein D3C83_27570 [compost metagenome]